VPRYRFQIPEKGIVSSEQLGESPVWPTLAILTAAALYATLPGKFLTGQATGLFTAVRWLVPALTILLLIPLLLGLPRGRVFESAQAHAEGLRVTRRILSLAVLGLITLATAGSIALLVHFLLHGAHTQAPLLFRAGLRMWCMNVLLFGLWYWQLDGGGPLARRQAAVGRDFLFPQETLEGGSAWQPQFLDYLYVAFTNSTAFSPTDAMPLSIWAKVLMMVQSAASLLVAILVVARAVNILH
jgi:hypothetical protein